MTFSFQSRPKTASFLLGLLAVAALPPYFAFPALFVSLSGLMLLLNRAQTDKRAFALGYWFGFGFFALGFSWIGNALLIDHTFLMALYPLVPLASGAFFGLFTAISTLATRLTKPLPAKILIFAAAFALMEWIRSFILTGFPWNLLGSTLAFSTITLQFAALAGTYGLTILTILITAWPAAAIEQKSWKPLAIPAALAALALIFGAARLNQIGGLGESSTLVRIVQPSIPQSLKWQPGAAERNFHEYIDLSRSEGFDKASLVVWGETASPFLLDFDAERLAQAQKAVPKDGYLLTGLVRFERASNGKISPAPNPLNSALVIDRRSIVASYDKSHLVPFGEYIPLRKFLPAGLSPITRVIADFLPGDGPKTLDIDKKIPRFGISICYEIIFPAEVVDRADRPQMLVNLTNDGWYGDSMGPRQHLAATRLRAVEEGVIVVRAANSGISAVISPTGEILGQIGLNERGVLDVALPKKAAVDTPYGQFGNAVPLALIALLLILSLGIRGKKA